MKVTGVCAVALSAALLASGCGYRMVRHPEIATQHIAQDSVMIASLQEQLVALRTQCRADSVRLENELTAQRTTAAVIVPPLPTVPDSLLKARAAEIAGLKEQLAKVSAELDRIKRRLANPRG